MTKIVIAISMVTYNHSDYIAKAIEGVLMQKAKFDIRLFITDDCSTDNTASICQKVTTQQQY